MTALRVLVCEDSRVYAAALQRVLEYEGDIAVAAVCTTAEQAIALLPRVDPDLVTMDIELPGMDGLKAVETIMGRRPVPIPHGLATRLRALAADRPATAPLLVKPSGATWKKSDHSRPFARAAAAAGQDPDEVTMYALRHTNIVRQLLAGVPIRVVAVNHDTSIAMLERTYSRHIGDHADALARATLLDTGETAGANVVPIRA